MSQYIDQAGNYLCKVVAPSGGWFGEQGDNRTPFIRLPLIVTDRDSEQHGRTITCRAWLSDKAVERTTKNLVEVFGWDGNMGPLARGEDVFTDKPCRIVVEMEDGRDGKKYATVKWLNSVGGGGKPMEAARVESLVERLSAKTKAAASAPKASAAAEPDLDAPEEPDQIPF